MPTEQLGEQLYQLIAPYLPGSIAGPLHQLLTLNLTDKTQLITLGASLLALYAAVMSMWSTIRMSFRAAMFTMKWGAIASVLAVAWSGYQNAGTEEGATKGLRTAGNIGKKAYGLGSQGVNWYLGSGAQGKNSRRSASGRQRTWAKATEDGGWDDPAEVDLGASDAGDVLKSVQDAVLTFLSGSSSGASTSTKKTKAKAKAKGTAKKAQQQGNDLGSMASNYAMGKAKQMWADYAGL